MCRVLMFLFGLDIVDMAGRDTDIEMNSNKLTNNESVASIDHNQSYESIDNSGRGKFIGH